MPFPGNYYLENKFDQHCFVVPSLVEEQKRLALYARTQYAAGSIGNYLTSCRLGCTRPVSSPHAVNIGDREE